VWQCVPESRGRLAIKSADPMDAPRIEPRYLDKETDRKALVAGLRSPRDLPRAARSAIYGRRRPMPGAERDERRDLLDYAQRTGGTVFHASGTCRMGTDELAVVDPSFASAAVERLRVIDASVMPTVTSANTNAAALMIAEKGAALL
jgi:choline dehydrogenase